MRNRFLMLLFSVLMAFQGAWAHLCVYDLTNRKPQFEFRDPRLTMKQDERAFLGSGSFGSLWLYFSPSQGKWIVLKKYSISESMKSETSAADQVRFNTLAMNFLKRFEREVSLKVAEYKILQGDQETIQMDYFPGKTLLEVLGNQNVPSQKKQALLESFRLSSLRIVEKSQKLGLLVERVLGPNPFEPHALLQTFKISGRGPSGEKIQIWIKPDNIMVDPFDFSMTIIDPQ